MDATGLYRTKRSAGVAFEAALRNELTRRLGVSWLPPVKDSADIAGIPARVLRLFSKRRDQIEAELARTGTAGPQAAGRATLATRTSRIEFDPDRLEASWHAQAVGIGWGPDQLDALLAHASPARPEPTVEDLAETVAARLIETDSSFTRHDIAQVVAANVADGVAPERLDQLTAAVLARPEIIPLTTATGTRTGWEQRYTTRALVELEAELLDAVANRIGGPIGALGGDRIAAAIRNATMLGADQQTAVQQLLGQGDPVEVLVGKAGTGKTFTLATVAAAYQAAGYRMVGVAPSARAARELADGTGLETFTVPRYHHAIKDRSLDPRSIVLVDEAGMCGTVDLHSVVTTARRAGAKVILVGDHHQLPEISAGGGFRAAVDRLGGQVCELTVNRRVTEPWEIDALDELRCGHVGTAWAAYRSHDRVTIGEDHADTRELAVADWWAAHSTGGRAFLLAGTRAETILLNHLARRCAAGEGHLHGPAIEVHGRTFQAGDRVLLTRNDANQTSSDGTTARVDNGTLATIAAIHPDRTITIRFDNDRSPVTLTREYVAAGWVEHGYAMTIHKSQGATCDQAFVVGPAGLYREAAYVAMSRARRGAHLYVTAAQAAPLTELGHSTGIALSDEHDQEPEHELIARLERSEAKTLALAGSPHPRQAAQLATHSLAALERRLADIGAAHAALSAAGFKDPAPLRDEYARAAAVRHACRSVDG